MVELYDFAKGTIVKVERDPFAERPAQLPTALPKFSPPPKPTTPTNPLPLILLFLQHRLSSPSPLLQ